MYVYIQIYIYNYIYFNLCLDQKLCLPFLFSDFCFFFQLARKCTFLSSAMATGNAISNANKLRVSLCVCVRGCG